eukprot:3920545-Pleurochrysis_carterae.AAC.2
MHIARRVPLGSPIGHASSWHLRSTASACGDLCAAPRTRRVEAKAHVWASVAFGEDRARQPDSSELQRAHCATPSLSMHIAPGSKCGGMQ